jgi:hypothetical protein
LGGEGTIVECNLVEMIRNKKQPSIPNDSDDDDEDDTVMQYCSDGDNGNKQMTCAYTILMKMMI